MLPAASNQDHPTSPLPYAKWVVSLPPCSDTCDVDGLLEEGSGSVDAGEPVGAVGVPPDDVLLRSVVAGLPSRYSRVVLVSGGIGQPHHGTRLQAGVDRDEADVLILGRRIVRVLTQPGGSLVRVEGHHPAVRSEACSAELTGNRTVTTRIDVDHLCLAVVEVDATDAVGGEVAARSREAVGDARGHEAVDGGVVPKQVAHRMRAPPSPPGVFGPRGCIDPLERVSFVPGIGVHVVVGAVLSGSILEATVTDPEVGRCVVGVGQLGGAELSCIDVESAYEDLLRGRVPQQRAEHCVRLRG